MIVPLFKKYLAKSNVFVEKKQYVAAQECLNSAHHMQPQNIEVIEKQSQLFLKQKKYKESYQCLSDFLERQTQHITPHRIFVLANLLVNKLHQPQEGIAWLRRLNSSIPLTPSQEEKKALLMLEAHVENGHMEQAWNLIHEHEDSSNCDLLFLSGWVALQKNHFVRAKSFFQRLLQLQMSHADAHYYLGLVYELERNFVLMKKHFQMAFQLDQLNPPELSYSIPFLQKLLNEILKEHGFYPTAEVKEYPSLSELEFPPHDPRQVVRFQIANEWEQEQWTLFHWNLERYHIHRNDLYEEMSKQVESEIRRLELQKNLRSS